MKLNLATKIWVGVIVGMGVAELYLVATGQELLSNAVYDADAKSPFWAFGAGVFVGHLFARGIDTLKEKAAG